MTKKQVSPEWQFGARLAFALQKQAVSDDTLSFKSSPAPKTPAPSRGAFMQGGLKPPAVPKPLSAPKPGPAEYRGKNEFGAIPWSPTMAPHQKSWDQLFDEQGMQRLPGGFANKMFAGQQEPNRYGMLDSFGAGLRGLGGAALGAGANLVGTVVGRPVAWAVDNTAGLAGYNPGWQEGVNDTLAVAQDMRDRGTHQFLYNGRSRALDDMKASIGERVQEHAPSMTMPYATASFASDVAPEIAGYGRAFSAGGKLLSAGSKLPGAARAIEPAAKLVQNTPAPVRKALTYYTGAPLAKVPEAYATTAFGLRALGHAGLSSFDAANAQAGQPTNYRFALPTEQGYTSLFEAGAAADDKVAPMATATLKQDAAGQNVALTPDGQAIPFSQLSPEQAQAVLSNNQNLETAQQTFTEIPNNLKSPNERALSGTVQDPYGPEAAALAQSNTTAPQQPADMPYVDAVTYADPDARAELYQRAGMSPYAASYATLPSEQKQQVDSITQTGAQPTEQAAQPGAQMSGTAGFKLRNDAPPEVAAQVDAGMKTVKESPDAPLAVEALQKPDGPAAAEMNQRGAQNMVTEAAKDPNNPPPTDDPNAYGSWLGGVMDSYEKMDPAAKIALGLGLGLGLIGLLGSFSEEGGVGGFLAAALGLGVAGATAAGGGMFGQQGQDFAGNIIGGLGQMTGMIPQSLTPDQKAILTSKDPIQTVLAQGGGMLTREQAAQKVQEARAQMQQLQRLQGLGGMQNSVLQRMGLTPEESQQAAQNVGALTADYADPNGRINKMLQSGEWYADPNQSGLLGGAYDAVSGAINSLRGKQGSADIGVALRIYKQRVASLC